MKTAAEINKQAKDILGVHRLGALVAPYACTASMEISLLPQILISMQDLYFLNQFYYQQKILYPGKFIDMMYYVAYC